MNEVRSLCRDITAGPPPAASLTDFCDRLGGQRGRPIVLLPFVGDGQSPSGLWLKGTQRDYVCYDAATSPMHQEAIIWHELSHMLLGHPGPVADALTSRLLLPDLDPGLVARMLGRAAYTDRLERQAEELASWLMLDRTEQLARLRTRPPDGVLRRLRNALNFRDRDEGEGA
jgi:IrrE N-terminal-like domain